MRNMSKLSSITVLGSVRQQAPQPVHWKANLSPSANESKISSEAGSFQYRVDRNKTGVRTLCAGSDCMYIGTEAKRIVMLGKLLSPFL